MLRRALALLTAALTAASASIDLAACGDKFLRAGRSSRTKGYATVYPSSILIYAPRATTEGLEEMESMLKRAGHTSVSARSDAQLRARLAGAKYDLVLANYSDSRTVQTALDALSLDIGLVPILDKRSQERAPEAEKQYHCVIKLETMTKDEALEEIDHFVELRRKRTNASANRSQ